MTKLDFMLHKEEAFAKSCLARAAPLADSPDCVPTVSSPEDIVLNKMLFYKEGGPEKHLRDIASVLKMREGTLDRAYIQKWAATLGVLAIWNALVAKTSS